MGAVDVPDRDVPEFIHCSFCKRRLPHERFSRAGPTRNPHRAGRSYVCRDCRREYRRQERVARAVASGRPVPPPRPRATTRPGWRRCARCIAELPADAFRLITRRRRLRDGSWSETRREYRPYCSDCERAVCRENGRRRRARRTSEERERDRSRDRVEAARERAARRRAQLERTAWVCAQARSLAALAIERGVTRKRLCALVGVNRNQFDAWRDPAWEAEKLRQLREREGRRPGLHGVRPMSERKVAAFLGRLARGEIAELGGAA